MEVPTYCESYSVATPSCAPSEDQAHWRRDLEHAREVQMSMYPPAELAKWNTEISGCSQAAGLVGGDYYDCLLLARERLGLVVGDVSGHGVHSGLLMALTAGCLYTQVEHDDAPRAVMAALRRALNRSTHFLLMSLCYVVLDPRRSRLEYFNAGHVYPYLYSAGRESLEPLQPTDVIFGVDDPRGAAVTEPEQRPWEPGDLLVLYTDGVVEARDRGGQLFGFERLEECIWENRWHTPAEIRRRIGQAVVLHSKQRSRHDDTTCVVARAA